MVKLKQGKLIKEKCVLARGLPRLLNLLKWVYQNEVGKYYCN